MEATQDSTRNPNSDIWDDDWEPADGGKWRPAPAPQSAPTRLAAALRLATPLDADLQPTWTQRVNGAGAVVSELVTATAPAGLEFGTRVRRIGEDEIGVVTEPNHRPDAIGPRAEGLRMVEVVFAGGGRGYCYPTELEVIR